MNPLRLSLYNFSSYAQQDLNLQGIHLACVIGDNGAGKSSLFDALTWSIWGQARTSHDGLVRQGQTEMRVTLDFESGGSTYRVIRSRNTHGRGSSALNLLIANNAAWTSLTCETIRKTQAQITDIVGLDYSTFVRTAFFRQGDADAFTNIPPGQRKAVLSTILQTTRWTKYRKYVTETGAELRKKLTELDAQLQVLSKPRGLLRQRQRDVERLQQQATQASTRLAQAQVEWDQVKDQARHIHNLQQQVLVLQTTNVSDRLQQAETRSRQLLDEIQELDAILSTRDAIEQLKVDMRDNQARLTAMEELGSQLTQLSIARRQLVQQYDSHERELTRLRGEYDRLSHNISTDEAQARASEAATTADALHTLDMQEANLEGQNKVWSENSALSNADSARQHITAELQKIQTAALEPRAAIAEFPVTDAFRELGRLEGRKEEALATLHSLTSQIDGLADEIKDIAQKQNRIQAQIEAIEYSLTTHEALREKVASGTTDIAVKEANLERATKRMPVATKQLGQTQAEVNALRAESEKTAEQLRQLNVDIKNATTTVANFAILEEKWVQAQHLVEQTTQELGAAEARLQASTEANAAGTALEAQRPGLVVRLDALECLYVACGPKGVPAILLEVAIPEIEFEANRLLGRMTGGQMALRMVTQRDTKAGDVSETLDIFISNDGERPYETYSGGEQLRINIAIRIALSRVLARRSGSPFQTLLLDEGFGSQDAAGRLALVDAIGVISDEFSKILVVTHIPDVANAFPVQIKITKNHTGSQIQ